MKIKCNCGKELRLTKIETSYVIESDMLAVVFEPCSDCLARVGKDAYLEGYQSGHESGYMEGKNEQ